MNILLNGVRLTSISNPVDLDMAINEVSMAEEFGMLLINYEVTGAPSKKSPYINIPGMDGVLPQSSTYNTGGVKIEFVFVADTVNEVMDKYRDWVTWIANCGETFNVTFSDDPAIYRICQTSSFDDIDPVQGVDSAIIHSNAEFLMPDPFVYELTETKSSFVMKSGEAVNLMNLGFRTGVEIEVQWDETTSVDFAASSLGMNNLTDESLISDVKLVFNDEEGEEEYDGYILFTGSLGINDILEIDTKEYEIKLNGENAVKYFDGSMPSLAGGKNTLVMTNDSGAPLKVTFKYHRRWL